MAHGHSVETFLGVIRTDLHLLSQMKFVNALCSSHARCIDRRFPARRRIGLQRVKHSELHEEKGPLVHAPRKFSTKLKVAVA